MNRIKWVLIVILMGVIHPSLEATAQTTYDAVSTDCYAAQDVLHCNYKVGNDLYFYIHGVGESDIEFGVLKTEGLDGVYYATFRPAHGCVVIWPGRKNKFDVLGAPNPYELLDEAKAFISFKNGKAYRTWEECQTAH